MPQHEFTYPSVTYVGDHISPHANDLQAERNITEQPSLHAVAAGDLAAKASLQVEPIIDIDQPVAMAA